MASKHHLKAVKVKVKGYTAKRYVALKTPAERKAEAKRKAAAKRKKTTGKRKR